MCAALIRLRRWLFLCAFECLLRALSLLARLHPLARLARHGVRVQRDVPYRGTGSRFHKLDVYLPTNLARSSESPPHSLLDDIRPTDSPHPVVLYAHGGGFRLLSKDTHWPMGLLFARQGYLVCSINYRLGSRHPFPAALEDACDALLWIREHAADYGGDPGRIVLAGESAGANLVLALAVCCSYRRPEPWASEIFDSGIRPAAVISACGILQVSDPARFWRRSRLSLFARDAITDASVTYLGSPDGIRPDGISLELADPLLILERGQPDRPLPPTFAFVGTRDPLLPDTRRLRAALARTSTPRSTRFYKGELHAFYPLVWRAAARRCWRDIFEFLDRTLGSAGASGDRLLAFRPLD